MNQKMLIGYGGIFVLVVIAWFGIRALPNDDEVNIEGVPEPYPSLSSISAEYVTSTDQVRIRWDIDNVDIPALNTGVRYDVNSHGTSSATSATYPNIELATEFQDGYEALIDVSGLDTFYYRIQVGYDNEFLWSDEAEVLLDGDVEISR